MPAPPRFNTASPALLAEEGGNTDRQTEFCMIVKMIKLVFFLIAQNADGNVGILIISVVSRIQLNLVFVNKYQPDWTCEFSLFPVRHKIIFNSSLKKWNQSMMSSMTTCESVSVVYWPRKGQS